MRKSISMYKYCNKKEFADFYVEQIVKNYKKEILSLDIEALIPVPIYKSKLKKRGFNQAELISYGISNFLGIKTINDMLIRNKNTIAQKDLNDKQRFENLKDAFKIKKIYKLNTVMLIDDIYTTGSTIENCTKVLLEYGIKKVYFMTICIGKG